MTTPASTTASQNPPAAPAKAETPLRLFIHQFCDSKLAMAGGIVLALLLLAALLAPWLSPQNPYDLAQLDIMDSRQPPGSTSAATGKVFLFGTDEQGRDMLSAMLYGLRISLTIGTLATLVALVLGVSLGLIAGYSGGRFESLLMRLVDIRKEL